MSNYTIEFKNSAVKELHKLPNIEVARIANLIESLSKNPRPSGCKKLKVYANLWRVRSGDYRIIYSIEDQILVVEILEVVNRKDAY
jgi:mRNA interferase RelE/StbE